MNRLIIVGELNPYGSDPKFALYHLPRGASGDRLRQHLGLTDETYERLVKVNLCAGQWSSLGAKAKAKDLLREADVLVLLGSKVRTAFGGPPAFTARITVEGQVLVSLPHPSGRCRAWAESGARQTARRMLDLYVPGVPWGETP